MAELQGGKQPSNYQRAVGNPADFIGPADDDDDAVEDTVQPPQSSKALGRTKLLLASLLLASLPLQVLRRPG